MKHPAFPQIPGQRGLATTRQLHAAGWTPGAVRHLVDTRGRRVAWGVFAPHRGPLADDDWVVAAWLWAGTDAVLTGAGALARRQVDVSRTPPPRFLVPPSCRTRRGGPRGALTTRTKRVPTASVRRDVPVAPLERSLVDAGRFHELPHRELRALTLRCLQERRMTSDRLEAELEAARPYGGAPLRDALAAFRQGSWSVAETDLADAVGACTELPPMLANPRLETLDGELVGYPDGYFPDVGVAVQVHSREHHDGLTNESEDRWVATVEHDTAYRRLGVVVVPVTPTSLAHDPAAVASALLDVVRSHAGRALPPVRVVAADAWCRSA